MCDVCCAIHHPPVEVGVLWLFMLETSRPRRYEILFENAAILMVIINAVLGLGIVWSIHAK